jgi:hypothetical protein
MSKGLKKEKILLKFLISLVMIGVLGFLYVCDDTKKSDGLICGQSIKQEATSFDEKYVATVFIGSCGATTSNATQVNLRKETDIYLKNPYGRITQGIVFQIVGEPKVTLVWNNARSLKIIVEGNPVRETFATSMFEDVEIQIQKRLIP